MASIPEHIVERVKSEANIVDVIADYVQLRRTGRNWTGLCPFHDDKKPSMSVEPVRGIFKCFACGKGGNVFTFLMEINGWSFPETVRNLATSLHIEIPEDNQDRQQYSENEQLIAALNEAAKFYQKTLFSEVGTSAHAYFRKREFTDETIRSFTLGYAPDGWEELLKHLSKQSYSTELLEQAGLVLRKEGRTACYDRFRGRAMFPIFSATGRILGFGARRMNDDPDQPKYINTPESPVYHKSRVLYGLWQAKDAIRKSARAVIVEGYADVVSLHQAGVQTAIATCGTAMTAEHAELLKRYTPRVVLVFDSDKAGQIATDRGIDVLLKAGLDVAVLRLPDGEDPDTFVKKVGGKEFEGRVDSAVSFLEFRVRSMRESGDLDSPERKTAAIRSIAATVALIPDTLKRELVLEHLISNFSLPAPVIRTELNSALGTQAQQERRRRTHAQPPPQDVPPPTGEYTVPVAGEMPPQQELIPVPDTAREEPVLRRPVTRDEFPPEELGLLSVLAQGDPQLLEHVFERIETEDFTHPLSRSLVELILANYAGQRRFSTDHIAMEDLPSGMRDLLTLLVIERESISDYWLRVDPDLAEPNPWRIARDCLIRLEHSRLERNYRAEQEKLLDPELDEETISGIFMRLKDLGARKHELSTLIG